MNENKKFRTLFSKCSSCIVEFRGFFNQLAFEVKKKIIEKVFFVPLFLVKRPAAVLRNRIRSDRIWSGSGATQTDIFLSFFVLKSTF
jgi:hypothetical protein